MYKYSPEPAHKGEKMSVPLKSVLYFLNQKRERGEITQQELERLSKQAMEASKADNITDGDIREIVGPNAANKLISEEKEHEERVEELTALLS